MTQRFTIILPCWQKNKDAKLRDRISTNEIYKIHYQVKKRYNDLMYDAVRAAVQEYRIKKVTEYPVELRFVFCFTGHLLDGLNCGGMAKCIEDGLRYAGILKDDTSKEVCEHTLRSFRSVHGYSFCNVDIVD